MQNIKRTSTDQPQHYLIQFCINNYLHGLQDGSGLETRDIWTYVYVVRICSFIWSMDHGEARQSFAPNSLLSLYFDIPSKPHARRRLTFLERNAATSTYSYAKKDYYIRAYLSQERLTDERCKRFRGLYIQMDVRVPQPLSHFHYRASNTWPTRYNSLIKSLNKTKSHITVLSLYLFLEFIVWLTREVH